MTFGQVCRVGILGVGLFLSACSEGQLSSLLNQLQPPAAVLAGSVRGRVLDAETAQPVAGATVAIGTTALQATSGSDGGYEVTRLPAGIHFLKCEVDGYLTFFGEVQVQQGVTLFDVRVRRPAIIRPSPSATPSPGPTPSASPSPTPSPTPVPASDVTGVPASDTGAAPGSDTAASPAPGSEAVASPSPASR